MMKIALVILHADPARGGAERYTVDLAAALHARGVDVTLAASTFGPESVPYTRLHLPVTARTRLGCYNRFLTRVQREVSGLFDIVHAMLPVWCDIYHPHAGLAAESIVTGHEKYDGPMRPLAALANRFNRKRRRFAAVERALLTHPDAPVVLCLSDYVKATVRRRYPTLPDDCLATLFNAVALTKFDPTVRPSAGLEIRQRFNIPQGKTVALIIAQDYQRKGLAEAIEALPAGDSRLVLLVVGKQDPSRYRDLARRLHVADRVIFAGPTTDAYAFYKAANFFVLPTRHDPCSLVVLEALAMGLPVISTIFNGACEIMTDGTHGFVLNDPRDLDTLRNRYRAMLDDDRRKTMSAACLALRPRLSYDHHLDRLLEIYRNVAQASRL